MEHRNIPAGEHIGHAGGGLAVIIDKEHFLGSGIRKCLAHDRGFTVIDADKQYLRIRRALYDAQRVKKTSRFFPKFFRTVSDQSHSDAALSGGIKQFHDTCKGLEHARCQPLALIITAFPVYPRGDRLARKSAGTLHHHHADTVEILRRIERGFTVEHMVEYRIVYIHPQFYPFARRLMLDSILHIFQRVHRYHSAVMARGNHTRNTDTDKATAHFALYSGYYYGRARTEHYPAAGVPAYSNTGI